VRRLIINADDFGLTEGVNQAIAECHSAGTVTSSTLMANSRAFGNAVATAKSAKSLGIGCHVMLVDGEPIVPSAQAASLLANGSNRFREGFAEFAFAAMQNKLSPDHIFREAAAQMEHIQTNGRIKLTHFDTHKHTHIFPQVLRPLLRAAKECGVRALRNPFVPFKALALAHLLREPKLWVRYSEVKVLNRFAAAFRREVEDARLRTTDGTFGIIATGALDQRLFNAIIGSIPEGTWEFVCHPGYNNADLDKVATRLRSSRDAERNVLTSSESKRQIESRGIQLISYAEL
jgi:predicted glycoside hydrolase/deacetylase ChbG (UPF0249 family)